MFLSQWRHALQKEKCSTKKCIVWLSDHLTSHLRISVSFHIRSSQEDGETFVKTMSDCWIVGRKSDQRELFVILNQKNANLIEIDGEWFQIEIY